MKRILGAIAVVTLGLGLAAGLARNAQAIGVQETHKIGICHGTASEKNPYVLIYVDLHALKGHFDGTAPGHGKNNHPDFIAGNGGCDTRDGGGSDS